MNQRVLVTYATKAGSTVAVADAIGAVLAARGFSVTVKAVKDRPALDGYQAVVIGSAIRMGSWLPEAVAFARDNRARLSQLPTAIFTVHMLHAGDDAASRAARLAYTAPVRKFLTPRAEAFFTGKLDTARLGFLDRMLAKAANAGEGDQRDWSQVRGWAQTILA
jgi:menaquinone-dependent protoporphyrinogen oxidase